MWRTYSPVNWNRSACRKDGWKSEEESTDYRAESLRDQAREHDRDAAEDEANHMLAGTGRFEG